MGIENKDKKKTETKKRFEFTKPNFEKWFQKGLFPGLAVYSLLGGGFGLAALFAGAKLAVPDFELKEENHPWLVKIGKAIQGITD